jgi:capsular exopolysaccharide synthesis family protein
MLSSTSPSPPVAPALSLQTYLGVLRRKKRLILVISLLTMAFALVPSILEDPTYSSTASVRISALEQEGVFGSDAASDGRTTTDRAIELLTEMEIITSAPMRSAVLAVLPEDQSDFEDPEVEQVGFSQVVDIRIVAGDPTTAADVANAYADVFIEQRRNRATEALVAKADELRGQSADATAELDAIGTQLATPGLPPNEITNLQVRQTSLIAQVQDYNRRADELGVEAALRGRGTQLISPGELELDPISSSRLGAAALGLTLGFLLALVVAFISDTLQDRLGSRDDLAAVRPDLSVLAAVPHTDFDASPGPDRFAVQEAFRYLRTGVRIFGLNAQLRSVMVTSAISGEGKTTTAANLGLAMAEAGDRVVIIDCDLRRPGVHRHFDLPNAQGLSTLMVGDVALDDVIRFVRPNLAVVTAGPTVQNPTELLGSEQFAQVLAAIVDQADFTILDTPPVLPVVDALIAGQLVDGAIVVSRIGMVRRRSVRELLQRLDDADVQTLGLVANDTTDAGEYGYYGPAEAPPSGEAPATGESPAPTPVG